MEVNNNNNINMLLRITMIMLNYKFLALVIFRGSLHQEFFATGSGLFVLTFLKCRFVVPSA